nr:hypothetical protein Iba_chr09aCG5280 [Ipomoea batatas]GMD32142.1 hypothetical protein Iba_chr09bCG5430 [Ipomoea batatas]GMD33631.1 hypothetical protein Iba_chr09cCG4450 [Ipomoea batatas]GMD35362.1 hypothetical protein Iba_chr09dCG6230 [Ipomoea batatas]
MIILYILIFVGVILPSLCRTQLVSFILRDCPVLVSLISICFQPFILLMLMMKSINGSMQIWRS